MVNLFYDIIAIFSLIAFFGWFFLCNYFFALCSMKKEISSNCRKIFSNSYPSYYFFLLFCVSYAHRFLLLVFDWKKGSSDCQDLEQLLLLLDHSFFTYYRHIIVFSLLFLAACVVCRVINEMHNEIFDEYYFQLCWFSYIYYVQSIILFPIYIINLINYFILWLFYPSDNKIESQNVLSRAIYFWFYGAIVFSVIKIFVFFVSFLFNFYGAIVFIVIKVFVFFVSFLFNLLFFFDNYFLIKHNESFESVVLRGLVRFVYGIYCVWSVLILMFLVISIVSCFVLVCVDLKFCSLFPIIVMMIIVLINTYISFQEYRMRAFAGRSYWLS